MDGSPPPSEEEVSDFLRHVHGKQICDNDFDTVAANKFISKKYGHRCKHGLCHFHHKRISFICASSSTQAMVLLVVAAILVLGIHSSQGIS